MAHVNEGSQFFYLPPTRLSTTPQAEWTCLYSPAADRHCTLAGTHFPSRWGWRAELACYYTDV